MIRIRSFLSSGSDFFKTESPAPVKMRPDPQHCSKPSNEYCYPVTNSIVTSLANLDSSTLCSRILLGKSSVIRMFVPLKYEAVLFTLETFILRLATNLFVKLLFIYKYL